MSAAPKLQFPVNSVTARDETAHTNVQSRQNNVLLVIEVDQRGVVASAQNLARPIWDELDRRGYLEDVR